jgi:hypothetical protein
MPVCSGIGGAGDGVAIWPESNDTAAAALAVFTDAANAVASVESASGVSCPHAGATAAIDRAVTKHRAVAVMAVMAVIDVMAVDIRRRCARVFYGRHE